MLVGDDLLEHIGQVRVRPAEQPRHRHHVSVTTQPVRQPVHSHRPRLLISLMIGHVPESRSSHRSSSQFRRAACSFFSHGSLTPPPLALRPLDQPDVPSPLDRLDPLRHHVLVILRPVRRDLGDRRGPVPGEPLRLQPHRPPLAAPARSRRPAPPASAPGRCPASRSAQRLRCRPAAHTAGKHPSPAPPATRSSAPGCARAPPRAASNRSRVGTPSAQTANGSTAASSLRQLSSSRPNSSGNRPEAETAPAWSR